LAPAGQQLTVCWEFRSVPARLGDVQFAQTDRRSCGATGGSSRVQKGSPSHVTATIDLPEGFVGLALTVASLWTALSFLLAVLIGHALRVLSDAG